MKRYLKEYAEFDGTMEGFQRSIKAMDPLHGLSVKEKKQFLKWLSEDDKKFLKKAMKYYRELSRGAGIR